MKKNITILHMTCSHCEHTVKSIAIQTGVTLHSLSLSDGNCHMEYENEDQFEAFKSAIEAEGYGLAPVQSKNKSTVLLLLLPLAVLALLSINGFSIQLLEGASLGAVFVYGLFSSLHCLSMCGGIALSACQLLGPQQILKSDFYYNLSRILSYTLIGGFLGLIGSGFELGDFFKAFILIASSLFMILLGLRQLGVTLVHFSLSKAPNPFFRLIQKAKHPVTIGLLNGFIPCGPLQMAQLFALSSGSLINGMLVMLVFGLGTFPTMFYVGSLNAIFTGKSRQIAFKISGVVILLMALLTLMRAYTFIELDQLKNRTIDNRTEIVVTPPAPEKPEIPFADIVDGFQVVHLTANRNYMLENVQVRKEIPVRLIIDAVTLNQCIDTITIPEYGITKGLQLGENIIEFTPVNEGELIITCWMNMVTQKLTVSP